jgi:hypothetical protein
MTLTTVHRAILDLLVEDSYGLWEIVWRLQDLFPERSTAEVTSAAREGVQELLDAGLISVWRLQEVGGEELPVPEGEIGSELAKESNWIGPQDNGSQIRILATEAGERAYYAGN